MDGRNDATSEQISGGSGVFLCTQARDAGDSDSTFCPRTLSVKTIMALATWFLTQSCKLYTASSSVCVKKIDFKAHPITMMIRQNVGHLGAVGDRILGKFGIVSLAMKTILS